MFCYKCGTNIPDVSKFCAACGAAVQQALSTDSQQPDNLVPQQNYQQTDQDVPQQNYQQPDQGVLQQNYQQPDNLVPQQNYQQYQPTPQPNYQQYQPYTPSQPPVPPVHAKPVKGLWWKIGIPAVFLITVLTVGLFYIAMLMSPLETVFASISNLGKEVEQRVDNTPVEAIGILFKSFESGSVTVDFHYTDMWDETKGTIALHMDDENGEAAIEAEISADGFELDFEIYINQERAAARISQIDNNFYGIIYDTFREDFRAFADLLELDQQTIDTVTDLIDVYTDILETYGDNVSPYEDYEKLIGNFFSRADVNSERVDFNTGDRSIKVRRIELTITDRMIIDFLTDFVDLLENDDYTRSVFDAGEEFQAGFDPYYSGSTYSEMIREFKSELRNLERDLQGKMIATFYIASGDRLMRTEVNFDFQYDGERVEFDISLDLGSSAHDVWVFKFDSRDENEGTSLTITWNIRETSRGGETSLTVDSNDRWGSETVTVLLDWNDRGNFTLSFVEDRNQETLISGVYTKINDGFIMVIDDPYTNSRWEESLRLEISVVNRSGHIKQIEFINISEWGNTLIEKLEDLLGFGSSSFMPPAPIPFDPPRPPAPPQPGLPPQPVPGQSAISEADLYGEWEFSHGAATYFFWTADHVEFFDWGEVSSSDSLGADGTWILEGNMLTVTIIDSFYSYYFTVDIIGDLLVITDSDNDTGHFAKIS